MFIIDVLQLTDDTRTVSIKAPFKVCFMLGKWMVLDSFASRWRERFRWKNSTNLITEVKMAEKTETLQSKRLIVGKSWNNGRNRNVGNEERTTREEFILFLSFPFCFLSVLPSFLLFFFFYSYFASFSFLMLFFFFFFVSFLWSSERRPMDIIVFSHLDLFVAIHLLLLFF